MAGIPNPILSLAVLLAVLSTPPLVADALKVGGENVSKMAVSGNVCCSPTGGLLGGILTSPAAGAKISIVIKGAVIATGATAADGSFNICINSAEVLSLIESISLLQVIVSLPILTCPILSTAVGTLEGIPAIVGGVVGGVCNLSVGSFTRVVN